MKLKHWWKPLLLISIGLGAVGFLSPALAPLCRKIDRRCTQVAADLPTIQSLLQGDPTEQAWASSGGVFFPLAANIMAQRHPQPVPLTALQKRYLRPIFGNLVDRVRVNYQAQLLDRWHNGSQTVHFGNVDSAAQAYCDRLYLRDTHQDTHTAQLTLLAHELTHSQQCDQLGGAISFGSDYFRRYYQAGQRYEDNHLEKAAQRTEAQFVRHLCTQVDCVRPQKYYANYKKTSLKAPVTVPKRAGG
jgi:hypothetical protein